MWTRLCFKTCRLCAAQATDRPSDASLVLIDGGELSFDGTPLYLRQVFQ